METTSETDYEAIVVGSDLGGLSTAAILVRAGLRVLVLEQGAGFGGLAHSFSRDGRTFDSAIRIMAEGEMVSGLLDYLGVGDECTLRPIDHLYRAEFPDMRIFAPAGLDEFTEAHVERFPHEAEGIRTFFGLRRRMFLELAQMPMRVHDPRMMERLPELAPTLMRYRTATLAQVMDEHLSDPRLKAACSALWPYMGAPPSQLSFFAFAQFIGVLVDGPYYCLGSFQSMVDAFLTVVRTNGGAALSGMPVRRILTTDGRATGVRTEDGSEFTAPLVVPMPMPAPRSSRWSGSSNCPDRWCAACGG